MSLLEKVLILKKRLDMTTGKKWNLKNEWELLIKRCKKKGIGFLCSPFSIEAFKRVSLFKNMEDWIW